MKKTETHQELSEADIAEVNSALESGYRFDIDVAAYTAAQNDALIVGAVDAAVYAVESVCSSETFCSAVQECREVTQQESEITIHSASILQDNAVARDCGIDINAVLIALDTMYIIGDGICDSLIILVDLNTGEIFDTLTSDIQNWIENEFNGNITNENDAHMLMLNSYANYAYWGSDCIIAPNTEMITDFDDAAIARLNDAIPEI